MKTTRSALILILLVLLGVLRPVAALGATVDLNDYEYRLRAVYATAQRADRIGLQSETSNLLQIDRVRLADGTELLVDNSWLERSIAQEPPPYGQIAGALGALLEALNQPRQPQDPTAQAKLDAVFNNPPFKDREVPRGIAAAWSNFWSAVGRALQRLLNWIFSRPLPAPSPSPVAPPPVPATSGLGLVGTILVIAAALVVLLIAGYALRGLRGSFVRDRKVRSRAPGSDDQVSAEGALQQGRGAATAGDYRSAVRWLYLSTLLWLGEQRLLQYDRSLTNREYLQQVGEGPLAEQLTPVVDTFDRVWYGKQQLDDAAYRSYEEQIANLRQPSEGKS